MLGGGVRDEDGEVGQQVAASAPLNSKSCRFFGKVSEPTVAEDRGRLWWCQERPRKSRLDVGVESRRSVPQPQLTTSVPLDLHG